MQIASDAAALFVLELEKACGKLAQRFFVGFESLVGFHQFGQLGSDDADFVNVGIFERAECEADELGAAFGGVESELDDGAAMKRLANEFLKMIALVRGQIILQGRASEFAQWDVEDLRETRIGVEDFAVGVESCGAVVDGFDEDTVGVLGSLKSDDFFTVGAFHDEGVNAATANGQNDFFGLRRLKCMFARGGEMDGRDANGLFLPNFCFPFQCSTSCLSSECPSQP